MAMMAPEYDRDYYSRHFARLLNRAMKQGEGDPERALQWLDQNSRPIWTALFSRHRAEMSDAYLDVREHIMIRIKENGERRKEEAETGG